MPKTITEAKYKKNRFDIDDPAYGRDDIFLLEGNWKDYYEEKETLGQGVSAVVKRCIKRSTTEEYAVKIVNYKRDDELELLVNHS